MPSPGHAGHSLDAAPRRPAGSGRTEADLGTYGAVDGGLYINTFLLAAQSLGLATAPNADFASYPEFLRDHFGIPDNRRAVAGISFGWFRTSREHPGNTVSWHTDSTEEPAAEARRRESTGMHRTGAWRPPQDGPAGQVEFHRWWTSDASGSPFGCPSIVFAPGGSSICCWANRVTARARPARTA